MDIQYIVVDKRSDSYIKYRQQFINLYMKIFSSYPFFEKFSLEEVSNVYEENSANGAFLCCAVDNNEKLIGFGAGRPAKQCNMEMKRIFSNHFPVEQGFYNSDVGTDEKYRGHGVGTKLVELRINYAKDKGYKYSVLRIAKVNSMSAPLYFKKGFKEMKETMMVYQPRTKEGINENEERMFLWKKI
jgi:GNAT superfamily N-acetyltransferase